MAFDNTPNPPACGLVLALVDETGVPPVSVRRFEGYLGPVVGGRRRMYLDDELMNAAEFAADAIRFHARYRPADAAVELDVVWVPRSAVTSWSRSAPQAAQGTERGGGGGGGTQATFR
jgi:hypothetical protein